jgi:hypothetical protein
MSSIVCPACKAYLGLAADGAANCPRCAAPLSGDPRDVREGGWNKASDARRGQLVLIAFIIFLAPSELPQASASLLSGQFQTSQVVRVGMTICLFWQLWAGAGWARWLMASLCFLAPGPAAVFYFALPRTADSPVALAILAGVSGVCLLCALGLASPWVGACQAAQREGRAVERDRSPETR